MLTLLIESGCQVSWCAGAVRIEQSNGVLRKVPVNQLEAVWIKGKVSLDSQVLMRLAQYGVVIAMVPVRGKDQVTYVGKPAASGARLRLAQSQVWSSESGRNGIAIEILQSKLAGYQLALCHSVLLVDGAKTFQFRKALEDVYKTLQSEPTYQSLLGIEGAVARAWFEVIKVVADKRFLFIKRNRRPPKDPINALMSFCYSLTLSDVVNSANLRGFDASFGFLHELLPGRDSLALDLLEPFRPLLDVFCVQLAQEYLKPEDFYYDSEEGCRIRKDAMSVFFGQFHRFRLDPFVDFKLPESPDLWPGQPQAMDGESLTWLIRQVCNGLAHSLYSQAEMEADDDNPSDFATST